MDLGQFPNHFNQLLSWVILQPHPWRPTTGDGCRPADGPPPRLRGLAGCSPGAQRRAAAAGDGGRQRRLRTAAAGRDGQRGKGRSGTKWVVFWFFDLPCLFGYLMLFDVIWCYLMLFNVIWCYLMLFDVIWCYLMLFDVIWCYLMLFDVIWCYLCTTWSLLILL